MEQNKTGKCAAKKDIGTGQGPKSAADTKLQEFYDDKNVKRSNKTKIIMSAVAAIIGCIVFPYVWYATRIAAFAHSSGEMPDGFNFPTYS